VSELINLNKLRSGVTLSNIYVKIFCLLTIIPLGNLVNWIKSLVLVDRRTLRNKRFKNISLKLNEIISTAVSC